MKRIFLLIAGMSFLFSCEYINGPTTIKPDVTSDYLLNGNLDVFLESSQIFRYKGKPGIEIISLGSNDLSKYEDCFILHVATGTTIATTVSSAVIKLDEHIVLNSSDFSKNSGQHTFEICNLAPTSVLTVEIKGQPGSFLDIWIEGKLKELIELTDADGNIYKTVGIGNQVWMAENLKTTHLNDGTEIPLVSDDMAWSVSTSPAYCWYNNDETANKNIYGALYNWYTVNTTKLCPNGWHVPTNDDWITLTTFLGGEFWLGEFYAGGKLKEVGTTHWESSENPNTSTNETGFTALPGGYRRVDGTFSDNLGFMGVWWTSTPNTTSDAFAYFMYFDGPELHGEPTDNLHGFSVRCIKDN